MAASQQKVKMCGKGVVVRMHVKLTNLGNSSDHVGDMGADRSNGGNLLLLAEPLIHLKLILLNHL